MMALDKTADDEYIDKLYDRMTAPPGWEREATCVGTDIDMFVEPERFAEELCAECPVKDLCLDLSKTVKIEVGVFGGKIFR